VPATLAALLLGILEGITEFLPISSTGHLILVRDLLPLGDKAFADVFDVVIQFPAILAVVILYRKRLWHETRCVLTDAGARRFWFGLFVAFLPAAALGFLAHDWIEERLYTPTVVASALGVGGIVILLVERFAPMGGARTAEGLPLRTSLGIGLFQCLSLVPGTSRSAATIIGGRSLGLTRAAAAEYSFFLALPTLAAASGYKLLSAWDRIDWVAGAVPLLVGCVASFATAYLVIAWFIGFLQTRTLAAFGWYRIALAVVVLALHR
jgi:undecaprenyl-diphosphatase